jgi:SAM-dependent methyltransferase
MARDDRSRWDERYLTGDWADIDEPAPIVLDLAPHLHAPGTALDLACGAGRNALFLAERGFSVMGVDISREGLRRLARRADERRLSVQAVHADLERFGVRPASFDVIVNTHFLMRSLFPLTFSVDEIEVLGGDIRRAFALERGELLGAFGDFELVLYEEGVFERDEGERGLARLIVRNVE